MAITELVFPVLKRDTATIEDFTRNKHEYALKLTSPNPGLLSAFRGWVVYEDEKDVRDECREFLILEWKSEALFTAFLGSDHFASFIGTIQHLLAGPPELQLYNTETSPKKAAAAPIVEVIRVAVEGSQDHKLAEDIWQRISQTLIQRDESTAVTYGGSLNLEARVIVGIIGWTSTEKRNTISKEAAFADDLISLRTIGKMSQLIVEVDELPVSAL